MTGPQAPQIAYSNLSPRPAGPFYRAAALVLPGVRAVQAQITPYARAWQQANTAALAAGPAAGALWVALGDSMTQGIGASRYDRGWVGQLGAQLAGCGHPVRIVNLSVSGARTGDVLAAQLPAVARLGLRPDLVTVLIGSNDLIRRRNRDALPGLFGELLDRLPDGAVIANMPNPRQAAQAVNALIDEAVTGRAGGDRAGTGRAAAGQVGTGHGVAGSGVAGRAGEGRAEAPGQLRLADLRSGGPRSWRGRLAPDHFHPNDLGYAGLAAAFEAPALARLQECGD